MAFRFRKSMKVMPGVRLNFGKSSASISIGPKGAKKTISTTGRTTASVGIPGTGISYIASSGGRSRASTSRRSPKRIAPQSKHSPNGGFDGGGNLPPRKPSGKQPWYMRKWVWAAGGVVLVSGIFAAFTGGDDTAPAPDASPTPTIAIITPAPVATPEAGLFVPEASIEPLANTQPAETPAPPQQLGTLNGTGINMRSGPGTEYDVVAKVGVPSMVVILGMDGDWYNVEVNGVAGYLRNDFVTLQEPVGEGPVEASPAAAPTQTMYVKGDVVNMRSGPGTEYDVVKKVSAPLAVLILGKTGDWYHVNADGTEGYLRKDLLTDVSPQASPASTPAPSATATPQAQTTATPVPASNPVYAPSGSNAPPPSGTHVWRASSTTSFYHSTSTCSNMKSPHSLTIDDALQKKLNPCTKCWSGVS